MHKGWRPGPKDPGSGQLVTGAPRTAVGTRQQGLGREVAELPDRTALAVYMAAASTYGVRFVLVGMHVAVVFVTVRHDSLRSRNPTMHQIGRIRRSHLARR